MYIYIYMSVCVCVYLFVCLYVFTVTLYTSRMCDTWSVFKRSLKVFNSEFSFS